MVQREVAKRYPDCLRRSKQEYEWENSVLDKGNIVKTWKYCYLQSAYLAWNSTEQGEHSIDTLT